MELVKDYTEEVDFSELKNEVGRPSEESIKRTDLKPYIVESQFRKRFTKFYSHWESIVVAKAKGHSKVKYITYMEEFYGEVLEKFNGLGSKGQKVVMESPVPMIVLYNLTNLSKPNVFHDKVDNDFFTKELIMSPLK